MLFEVTTLGFPGWDLDDLENFFKEVGKIQIIHSIKNSTVIVYYRYYDAYIAIEFFKNPQNFKEEDYKEKFRINWLNINNDLINFPENIIKRVKEIKESTPVYSLGNNLNNKLSFGNINNKYINNNIDSLSSNKVRSINQDISNEKYSNNSNNPSTYYNSSYYLQNFVLSNNNCVGSQSQQPNKFSINNEDIMNSNNNYNNYNNFYNYSNNSNNNCLPVWYNNYNNIGNYINSNNNNNNNNNNNSYISAFNQIIPNTTITTTTTTTTTVTNNVPNNNNYNSNYLSNNNLINQSMANNINKNNIKPYTRDNKDSANLNKNINNTNNTEEENKEKSGKYTCRFEILIDNDKEFQVARKLIGSRGCNMKKIVESCEGSLSDPNDVKLRLRGKGSGYKEGPFNKESDDPLHLCISSKNYDRYLQACKLVEDLINNVYEEYKKYCSKYNKNALSKIYIKKEEGLSVRKSFYN